MDQIFVKSAIISAEVRWVLNLVTLKYSMNSSSNSGDLLSVMFPDTDIVKRFRCGRTKAGYMAHFGLAPYFHVVKVIRLYFSLSFDESSNSSVQKGQMEIIRF